MTSTGAWKKKVSSSSSSSLSRRRSSNGENTSDVEDCSETTTTPSQQSQSSTTTTRGSSRSSNRSKSSSSSSGKKSLNLVSSQLSDVDSPSPSLASSNSQQGSSPSQLSISASSSLKRKLGKSSPSASHDNEDRKWKKSSPSKFSKIIQDDSEEEEVCTPPKKQKQHAIVISDEDDESDDERKEIKKKRTPVKNREHNKHQHSDLSLNNNWSEKYAPTNVSDLWIKHTIISDFENWLCDYPTTTTNSRNVTITTFNNNKPCIVIGPGGSGKRSMVYLMIQKYFGFGTVHIYHPNKINMIGNEDLETKSNNNWIEDGNNKGPNPNSVISSFRDFLRTAIVKKSLNFSSTTNNIDIDISHVVQSHTNSTSTNSSSGGDDIKTTQSNSSIGGYSVDIIIIEELPPVHTKQQKEKLFQALNQALTLLQNLEIKRRKRLVKFIVLHDHSSSSTADYDLLINFPKEFREISKVVKIGAPPPTKMKAILKEISKKGKCYSKIGDEDFDSIVKGSNGDLRHAINQLEYFVLGLRSGKHGDLFSSPVKAKKLKQAEKQAKKLAASIGKKKSKRPINDPITAKTFNVHMDIATTIHHAAARVLYGKRESNGRVEFNLEKDVLNVYKSEKAIPEQTLTNYVQANVPYFCNDISALSKSLEAFSLSDSSFGRKMTNSYEDTQQTTTFNEYQFLITSRAVLYHHQNHIPSVVGGRKHVLAPKILKSIFKEREEKLKQLLLLVKNQDCDETLIKKAYLGLLPFENVPTFSHLFNLRETLADTIPYLLNILYKTRSNIPNYLNINEMHKYPKHVKNSSNSLISSSDAIETCDNEADDTITFSSRATTPAIKQDISQSVVSSLISYLTLGLEMTEDAVFKVPDGEDITENSDDDGDDQIENDDEYYAEILDILETEATMEDTVD